MSAGNNKHYDLSAICKPAIGQRASRANTCASYWWVIIYKQARCSQHRTSTVIPRRHLHSRQMSHLRDGCWHRHVTYPGACSRDYTGPKTKICQTDTHTDRYQHTRTHTTTTGKYSSTQNLYAQLYAGENM